VRRFESCQGCLGTSCSVARRAAFYQLWWRGGSCIGGTESLWWGIPPDCGVGLLHSVPAQLVEEEETG
jgi:hypothetical protein